MTIQEALNQAKQEAGEVCAFLNKQTADAWDYAIGYKAWEPNERMNAKRWTFIREGDGLRVRIMLDWEGENRANVGLEVPQLEGWPAVGPSDFLTWQEKAEKAYRTEGTTKQGQPVTMARRILALLPDFETIHARALKRNEGQLAEIKDRDDTAAALGRGLGEKPRAPYGQEAPRHDESWSVGPFSVRCYGGIRLTNTHDFDLESALGIGLLLESQQKRRDAAEGKVS